MILKAISRLLLIVPGIVLFTSCATVKSTNIQILRPATIHFPAHIQKVGVLSRAYGGQEISWFEGRKTDKFPATDSLTAQICSEILVDQLNGLPRFEAFLADSVFEHLYGSAASRQKIGLIEYPAICSALEVDALVLLDQFQTEDSIYFIPDYVGEYAIFQLKEQIQWKMYDPLRGFQDVFTDQQTFYYEGYGESWKAAWARLPDRQEAKQQGAWEMAQNYAHRISPYWDQSRRIYYSTSHPQMQKGAEYAAQEQWSQAAQSWKALSQHKRKNLASSATFNMVLASEMMGHIDLALFWLKQLMQDYNDPYAEEYLKILNTRKAQVQRIEQQLNPQN